MFCRSCGKRLSGKEIFCKYCGTRQKTNYGADDEDLHICTEKSSVSNAIIIIIIVLTTIAVGAFLFFSLRKSDEQQAREIVEYFFESVKSGDASGAIECFTPAFQEQYSGILKASGLVLSIIGLPDVTGLVNNVIGISDYQAYQEYDFRVRDPVLSDDKKSGKVKVDVYVKGDLYQTTEIKVTKYHGKWYIEN